MLIPSIDLMDGKAVQLIGGRRKVIEVENVMELVDRWSVYGELAVIDLDAALGRGDNLQLVEKICSQARCRVGGGVRDVQRAGELLRAGAQKIIVGTAATPEFLRQLPREMTMVALDQDRGTLLSHGWQKREGDSPQERMEQLTPLCAGFLVTHVHREGRMTGLDRMELENMAATAHLPITYAGGVAGVEDVVWLDRRGVDAQVGMALYRGDLDPADCFVECAAFGQKAGLLPCVVQDSQHRLRMMAWQTPETLREALRSRRGIYFSRSRNRRWVKGECSGNQQKLIRAALDCDRDTISFTVTQAGPTCHTGQESCFGTLDFAWGDLLQKVQHRRTTPEGRSYTRRLFQDPELLDAKLREEIDEVIEASGRPDDLVWECADVLYFLTVKMVQGGIGLDQVFNELKRRSTTS